MVVNFWSFSKRQNSTLLPSSTPSYTFNCFLKDNSSVISPVLEIWQGEDFNPSALNYAQIVAYGRYYFVTDWTWILGRWEVSLTVDSLATYKTQIGNSEKFVVRSAYEHDANIVDTFYPTVNKYNYLSVEKTFPLRNDFDGSYIVAVANGDGTYGGTTTYYVMTSGEFLSFGEFIFPKTGEEWRDLDSFTDSIYKSIYNPLQYLLSCKYIPVDLTGIRVFKDSIYFGNYEVGKLPGFELPSVDEWPTYTNTYNLPVEWINSDAKYRSEPYSHMYFYMNPFGVIQLNPSDFTLSTQLKAEVIPDLISGEATLRLYAVIGSGDRLVAQRVAQFGCDIPLTAIGTNTLVATAKTAGGLGSLFGGVLTGNAIAATGGIAALGSALVELYSPSILSNSQGTPNLVMLTGKSGLYIQMPNFTGENNSDFGRPLYQNRTISSIPGYVKCGDGEIALNATPEEIANVSNFLTEGFFYE